MLAHMKKHPTNRQQLTLRDTKGQLYVLPKSVAQKYAVKNEEEKTISADEFFAPYEKKYTKPGLLLRGLRIREELTQRQFAKRIHASQANLSHMELGRRAIGRTIAKRIEAAFHVNYKQFLE